MQESAVIRLTDQGPVWYPPGSSAGPRSLELDAEREQLAALSAARRAPLVFAVPGVEVILREVEFSAAERRHISRALPFQLEDEFADDIEELHFAMSSLGRNRLGVGVCRHECMDNWAEALAQLPSIPVWIPEPLLLPWQPGEICLVVEERQVLVRYGQNLGFSVNRVLAPALLEAVAAEQALDTAVVYGRDQETDQALLPPALRDRIQWRTGDFAAALMLSTEEKQALNLRQGDYGPSLPLRAWWQQWRVAAAVLAAAFGLQVASAWASYASLEAENLALRQQVEAAYREAVPRGAVVDPERQLNRKLEELRGGAGGASFVKLFERVGRVINQQPSAQISSVNFSDKTGDVRLNILLADFRAVETVRTQLAESGLEVQLENSNAQGQLVRARFKVSE